MLESILPATVAARNETCQQHGSFTSRNAGHVWTSCPQCQREQIEAETRERIAALSGVRRVALTAAAKIPPRFAAADLHGPHAQTLTAWLDRAATAPASLVMLGPTGTGKTHLACALLRMAADRGIRCRYQTAAGFLSHLSEAWQGADISERRIFAEYVEPSILVLDDVGANSDSEKLRMRISQLLDDRYLSAKSTVLISNLKPAELQAEIGDRVYSRALENVTQINVAGKDRRRAA